MKLGLTGESVQALRELALKYRLAAPFLEQSSNKLLRAFEQDAQYAGPHILRMEALVKNVTENACMLFEDSAEHISTVLLVTAARIEEYLSSSGESSGSRTGAASLQAKPAVTYTDDSENQHVR